MTTVNLILIVLSMFVLIVILDYIWLGIITKNFIINQFGSLVKVVEQSISIKLGVGLLTWFIIALGCFIFAVNPSTNYTQVIIFGATFGFISYAIYDLTNLTFIVNYPVKFVFVDIAWGTFLCGAISTFGFFVKNILTKFI